MPILNLPEPAEWRGGQRFLVLAVAAGFGVSVVYLVLGLAAMTRGNYLTTVVTAGWVVFLLTFTLAVLLVGLARTVVQTTSDATGFTVWPDRRFTVLVLVGIVAAIPSMLVFALSAPFGAIEYANTRLLRVVFSGLAAVAVLVAITGLIAAWRRGGVGHIKLTPTIIENADILSTRTFKWDDVVDVAGQAKSRKSPRAVVLRLRNGGEEIISFADIYYPRGAGLYWLVRHYWQHPEDRAELEDARAADRLRDGRFDLG